MVPAPAEDDHQQPAPAEDGSVPASPTPPASPRIEASAGALSSCESEAEVEGEDEGEDEEDMAYGEGNDEQDMAYSEGNNRGGDRVVHFRERFDPENPFKTAWSDFKYPVAKHFVERFREAHAISSMFHLNDDLAAKIPVLKSTKGGRHISNAPFMLKVFCGHQEQVRTIMRRRKWSGSSKQCGTMSHECLNSGWMKKASRTAQLARQNLKKGTVRRMLPCRPIARAADGRDSAAVTVGYAS
jgi:hypothetical protein